MMFDKHTETNAKHIAELLNLSDEDFLTIKIANTEPHQSSETNKYIIESNLQRFIRLYINLLKYNDCDIDHANQFFLHSLTGDNVSPMAYLLDGKHDECEALVSRIIDDRPAFSVCL